jgi:hypothetical protein
MAPFGLGRRRPAPRPLRVRAPENALTAAGTKIRQRDADSMRRLIQPWQARAFSYYDLLGEIKYASQFYSRALSKLELYAAERTDDGEIVPTENEVARAYLERIQDPGGGRSGLLGAYGRLMFLVGEGYLFITAQDDEDEQWEMLSTDELRATGGGYVRYKAPSLLAEEYHVPADDEYEPVDAKTAVAYRIWKRHPRFTALADSPMQGVLEIAEELVILTQAVRARARSRLAGSGILLIPDEISQPPLEPVGDEDPEEDMFLKDLTDHIIAPISDEGSAAAVAPLLIRGKAEYLKEIRHLQLIDPTQFYPETGLRRECIDRLAMGLDMPAEILTGMAAVNHWGSWMIDEQSWKTHLQPVAQQFVDDVGGAYYRPALREAGVTDWRRHLIAYDASAVINHPDRTKDAKDLHNLGALSDAALRESAGFDDTDAPTEKERNRWIGVRVRDPGLAVYGIPTLRSGSELEPAPGEIEAPPAPGGGTETVTPGISSAEAVKGAPPAPGETPGAVVGSSNGQQVARVLGAADAALYRAREAAGNRLRSLAKRDPESAKLLDGVKVSQVAATLGPDRVRALGAPTDQDLVAGVRDLIEETLRLHGLDQDAAGRVAEQVERHAARTLYEQQPPPLPATFTNYLLGRVTGAKAEA